MRFNAIPVILIAAYLAFVFVWVTQFNKRIEPWIRERIGRMLGVSIVWRMSGRGRSWAVSGNTQNTSGCLLAWWEFVVTFLIGVGTLFVGLLVMGLVLFSIYG